MICNSGKSADFPELLFHRKGRTGKRYLLLSAYGCRAAGNASVKFKPAPLRGAAAAAAEGSTKRVEIAGGFLVLFCARKRVHLRRRCFLQKASGFKYTTTLCAGSIYFHLFFVFCPNFPSSRHLQFLLYFSQKNQAKTPVCVCFERTGAFLFPTFSSAAIHRKQWIKSTHCFSCLLCVMLVAKQTTIGIKRRNYGH